MTDYKSYKTTEIWHNDSNDPDLWHGKNGIIINSAALEEREIYFDTERVSNQPIPAKLVPLSFLSL